MSVAEYARNIGTKAKQKYRQPPITDPEPAIPSVFADATRWKTSCCGIEPSAIVAHAAMKAMRSRGAKPGKNVNLPAFDACSTTTAGPPTSPEIEKPM